jgi:hypothetical protein
MQNLKLPIRGLLKGGDSGLPSIFDIHRTVLAVSTMFLSVRKIDQYMPCNIQHAAIGGAAVYIASSQPQPGQSFTSCR